MFGKEKRKSTCAICGRVIVKDIVGWYHQGEFREGIDEWHKPRPN